MIRKFLLGTAFLLLKPLEALPPPVPSAGIIEREIEQQYEATPLEPTKEAPVVEIDIPEEKLTLPEGKKVFLKDIRIQGNESISSDEIHEWLKSYVNQDESIQDIYHLCQIISTHYAERGYILARAYPPQQTIEDGVLILEVLEGKIGQIEIVGNQYYSSAFIHKYFDRFQGHALQYNQFLRQLVLINENKDLLVGALLEKGKKVGTADLILRINDKRPLHLYLNENNYGRKLTTKSQFGGRLDYGNALVYGDRFSIAEVIGFPVDALYFTDLIYRAPLNQSGTSLEVAYLFTKFHVEEMTSLRLRGRSDIGTLLFTQAMIRNRLLSLDLFTSFDYKQFENYTFNILTSQDRLRVFGFGISFDNFLISHGRDYLTARLSAGIPHFLGSLPAVSDWSSRPGAGGRFIKLNVDFDHMQQLWTNYLFTVHASGQYSPYKLVVPEQIYIGGGSTVRGFPLASALGDSGYYLNFEFHIPPPIIGNLLFFKKAWKDWLQIVGFLDHGGVFPQSYPDVFEWGAGFGIRVNGPLKLALSLDVGFPLNHNNLSTGAFAYLKITGQPF